MENKNTKWCLGRTWRWYHGLGISNGILINKTGGWVGHGGGFWGI